MRSALLDLERTATERATRQRELASGRRIHTVSDDPAGAAGVVRSRAELGSLDRYVRASDSVESRLIVADSVLGNLVSQITAAKTAAAGANNSGQSTEQREAAATQIESIRDAIFSAISSQVAGRFIFSGTAVTTAPYQKTGSTIGTYQGNGATTSIDIDRSQAIRVTFDADAILRGTDPDDLFSELDSLASAIRAGNLSGIDAGLTALGRAFDRAVSAQSAVGVSLRAVDTGRLQLAARRRSTIHEISSREDANLAETISKLTAAETAHQAAVAALSRPAQLSLLDFLR